MNSAILIMHNSKFIINFAIWEGWREAERMTTD